MASSSFIPKGQDGLLLRNPLTQNYINLSMYRPKSQLHPRDIRQTLQPRDAQRLYNGSVGNRVAVYARHSPHPVRVRHMKGLLDIPICMVEDNIERRILWSAPSSQDFGIHYCPPGNSRYSANINKHIPAIGIVPVTYTWKEELERKTQNAIDKALGQTPHRRLYSREFHKPQVADNFDQLDDDQLLELLCRILQTDSVPTCQAWLNYASDTEKAIVMNMLRMAATGEIEANFTRTRPSTREHKIQEHQKTTSCNIPTPQETDEAVEAVTAAQISSKLPFQVPEHDTVVRSAHSRLASRQSSRPGSAFHQTLQEELDQQADRLSVQLRSRRPRSAVSRSSAASDQTSQTSQVGTRGRTRSWNTELPPFRQEPHLPPPPVKVTVNKEVLNASSHTSPRYTKWSNLQ